MQKLQVIGLECESLNKEVVKILNCTLRIVDRAKRLINVDVLAPFDIQTIMINLTLKYKTALGFKPFPLNVTEDLCDFLHGGKKQHKVLNVILYSVKDAFYNVNCPTSGYIGIRDADIQLQEFGVVPSGIYRFDLRFFLNSQPGYMVKGTAKYDNLLLFKV